MMSETIKQRRRADELSQIWDAYFPSAPLGVEYWMAALDDIPMVVLSKAIKHLARKRVQLRGNMTLEQMLTYLESSCVLSLKRDIASGIYKADQFKNPSLARTTPTKEQEASCGN